MTNLKALILLVAVGQAFSQGDGDKSQQQQQQTVSAYDPQLLNYQLQQLALQQFGNQQAAQLQYDTQPSQFPTAQQQSGVAQQQQISEQDYSQYLQQRLYQPSYQTQFATGQSQGAQVTPQQFRDQSQKQSLLGVAYSSAADASRTSFTGYGIKYSF